MIAKAPNYLNGDGWGCWRLSIRKNPHPLRRNPYEIIMSTDKPLLLAANPRASCQAVRKPNFFILGGPKCATTSLSIWLREHPNIFVPSNKEPDFFNTDDESLKHGGIATFEEYGSLFRDARPEHQAIGEASVFYLSSSIAVHNILRYQPEARFIVMVRNPVEAAPALHAEVVMYGRESVRDFRKAWLLQEQRRNGRKMPSFSWATRRLLYGDVCSFGAQLGRLLAIVPAERVLVICVDDILADARREYLRVLKFLGVPDDNRQEFPAHNTARHAERPRFARLWFILREIKCRLGITWKAGISDVIKSKIEVVKGREPISRELTEILRVYFEDDVEKLGRLLDRDLSRWLSD